MYNFQTVEDDRGEVGWLEVDLQGVEYCTCARIRRPDTVINDPCYSHSAGMAEFVALNRY